MGVFMGYLMHSLLYLPIYAMSKSKYETTAEKRFRQKIKPFEQTWGEPFDKFPPERQAQYHDMWDHGPWKFNAIAGFIDIGLGTGSYLTAHIYLRRKYLPKKHFRRAYSKSLLENQEIYYWCDLDNHRVNFQDKQTFVTGMQKLLDEGNSVVKEHNKDFEIPDPPIMLEKINFASVCRNLLRSKK